MTDDFCITNRKNFEITDKNRKMTVTGNSLDKHAGKCRPATLPAAVVDVIDRHQANQQIIFRRKLKRLQRIMKNTIVENAALCDTVAKLQEEIALASEERKYLGRKLVRCQSNLESQVHQNFKSLGDHSEDQEKQFLKKYWLEETSPWNTFVNRSMTMKKGGDNSGVRNNKSQGKRVPREKKGCPPISLNSSGKPVMPMQLGNLTVYSLGEVALNRDLYHSEDAIYPIGYCSTRSYANLADPKVKSLYRCTIKDGGSTPKFEISDNNGTTFDGETAAECHTKLMAELNKILEIDFLPSNPNDAAAQDRGLRFFGLLHPCVQNTIQVLPGARKCRKYKWIYFEVSRKEDLLGSICESEKEASLCHETLLRNIRFANNQ